MNTLDKIKRRIHILEIDRKEHPTEVQITRQEYMELPADTKLIDGVRLIVVDKLGDCTKKDCYAYQITECYGLNELYCKNKDCRFYRNDIRISKIETDIKKYAMK